MGGYLALGWGEQKSFCFRIDQNVYFSTHPNSFLMIFFKSNFIIWNVLCLKYRNTVTDPWEADNKNIQCV